MAKKSRKKKSQSGDRPENGGRQSKASGSNTAVAVAAKSPLFPAPLSSSAGSALPIRRHQNWQPALDDSAASNLAPLGKAVSGAAGALLKKRAPLDHERPRTAPTVSSKQRRESAARRRNSALDDGAVSDAAITGGAFVGGTPSSAMFGKGVEDDDDAGVMEEYEWARKNHERHQQAAFMQVMVKSFMTEEALLDVLLPIDTTVIKTQCAHFDSTCL